MKESSFTLAFESANFSASIALCKGETIITHRSLDTQIPQSYPLIHLIYEVMQQAKVVPCQLAGIITTVGPGSFTGLRNSIAIAKGFSLALQCPVIGLNSFEWVLRSVRPTKSLGIILDSRREEPFCALYDEKGQLKKPYTYLPCGAIEEFMEGAMIYDSRIQGLPTAVNLLKAAWEGDLWQQPAHYPLSPLYVRGADIGGP